MSFVAACWKCEISRFYLYLLSIFNSFVLISFNNFAIALIIEILGDWWDYVYFAKYLGSALLFFSTFRSKVHVWQIECDYNDNWMWTQKAWSETCYHGYPSTMNFVSKKSMAMMTWILFFSFLLPYFVTHGILPRATLPLLLSKLLLS